MASSLPSDDGQHLRLDVKGAGGSDCGERRDAAENRARILAAAEELFAQRGVAEVNMAEIAQAAGVGKGTLYRRFAHKGELCMALMDEQLRAHQDAVLGRLRAMQRQGASYLEQLCFFLQEVVHFTERHIPLLSEVQRSFGIGEGPENDAPFFAWQHLTVQGILRQAGAAGELADHVNIDLTVDFLLAPLTAPYYRYLRTQRGYSVEEICAGLLNWVHHLFMAKAS
ncbi:MAG: TetR/AcrR family transcriptional regulator [Caldilineae bacterium]|nr:MAG: TetR/AcrR family transcriptional regulator [Caldilineae bacterium]